LGIIPLAAGVVTTHRTRVKNSVWELIDYTMYGRQADKFTKTGHCLKSKHKGKPNMCSQININIRTALTYIPNKP